MGAPRGKPVVEFCPGCQTVVSPRWNHCPMCETRLRGPCPRCGKSDEPPLAQTCGRCGQSFIVKKAAGAADDDDADED